MPMKLPLLLRLDDDLEVGVLLKMLELHAGRCTYDSEYRYYFGPAESWMIRTILDRLDRTVAGIEP
jgi:hypothetical protein